MGRMTLSCFNIQVVTFKHGEVLGTSESSPRLAECCC